MPIYRHINPIMTYRTLWLLLGLILLQDIPFSKPNSNLKPINHGKPTTPNPQLLDRFPDLIAIQSLRVQQIVTASWPDRRRLTFRHIIRTLYKKTLVPIVRPAARLTLTNSPRILELLWLGIVVAYSDHTAPQLWLCAINLVERPPTPVKRLIVRLTNDANPLVLTRKHRWLWPDQMVNVVELFLLVAGLLQPQQACVGRRLWGCVLCRAAPEQRWVIE